jgi:hypothetical protein
VVLGAVAAIPAWLAVETVRDRRALQADWTFEGPPCAEHLKAPMPHFSKPLRRFEYEGVSFRRQLGNASCQAFGEGSVFSHHLKIVCQFSAPAIVEVTAGGRTTHYEPGFGRPAVVTLRNGAPRCVVGGWFRF